MTTASSRPNPGFGLTCKRVLLRPILWFRNALGLWRSRRDANPVTAARELGKVDARWRRKIDCVISSPDNQHIPRVPDAGKVADGLVTMHNGLRVSALGYYGGGILNMLVENRGVHEPQEERAFAEVLARMPSGATMLELGAYWGFYSLWFARSVKGAKCFLVEPDYACLQSGKGNFARAGQPAQFTQAYVGSSDGVNLDGTDILCVDGHCSRQGISHLNILHSDIQGFEVGMLQGAAGMLKARAVDYVFISTHSNPLHSECIERLREHGYRILADANLDESFSGDGLIVACSPAIDAPERLEISHRGGRKAG
jgi:hypothetical protein